jgi:hypothetical protein
MAQADFVPASSAGDPPPRVKSPPLGVILLALIVLVAFVVIQGRTLWSEWGRLNRDMTTVRQTVVVGYQNIHPNPTHARRPEDWFHDDGEFTLLWSGWYGGEHHWFRVDRGALAETSLSHPIGRDVIQAIDYPLVEKSGGPIWARIPAESLVVGFRVAGVESVYPIPVLEKVCVINDRIGDRPILLTFNPLGKQSQTVHLYDPIVDGQRVTLGMSGYFQDRRPLLYDRGTESIWRETSAGVIESIAGPHKGSRLRSIENQAPVSWSDWRWQHPKSRLLVGADRSKSIPEN